MLGVEKAAPRPARSTTTARRDPGCARQHRHGFFGGGLRVEPGGKKIAGRFRHHHSHDGFAVAGAGTAAGVSA
jgi:hypothetical protein